MTVQYFKYPDEPHWRHEMRWLGEDDHGVWLGAPSGSIVQRGPEPPIRWQTAFVQLIPRAGWYSILGNEPGSKYAIYVDITTAARWVAPDRVEMLDVDLDVVRLWDGTVRVLDEDEFRHHQRTRAYPGWLIDGARAAATGVVAAAATGREPFGAAPQGWLASMRTLAW